LVVSVSAWYLLRRRHERLARRALTIALLVALVAAVGQLMTGHASAVGVARHQPAKMAAFEGRYAETARADLYLFGWVDEGREQVRVGIAIPGMLDWLVQGNAGRPIAGLHRFAPEDRPPVNLVFQSYHLMVLIGMVLIGLSALGVVLLWQGVTYRWRWLLWVYVFSVLGPQIANQVGWISAEVGRQPWIVYGLLRTRDAVSPTVPAGNVLFSLILFTLIYLALLALFLYLLTAKIRRGPVDPEAAAPAGGAR
jgi:cytochrome d ubiquinol oxidase subunit I